MELPKKKYTIWDSVWMVFRVVPLAGILHLLRQIYNGIYPTLMLLTTAKFIDTALAIVAGEAARPEIWLPLAGIVGMILLDKVSWMTTDILLLKTQQKRNLITSLAVINKISRLDYR